MKFIDVGGGNSVLESRIISVVSFDAAPIKRLVQEAKENGMVIDATCGHKCLSVIIADSRHIILSAKPIDDITKATDDAVHHEKV